MAKWANDTLMDTALGYIQACDKMAACSQQPTTYTEAFTTYMLANTAMTPTTDFPLSDGASNGRKTTVAAKSGVSITNSGTATHIALGLSSGTTLRAITTCTSQALTAGGTVDFPSWTWTIADPT